MDEIYATYSEECSGAVDIPDHDRINKLAESFHELTRGLNTISAERLTQARSIYSKFICYNERGNVLVRARRQIDPVSVEITIGYLPVTTDAVTIETPPGSDATAECFNATECVCPENNNITEPCHFFACLTVSETKFICGFGNDISEEPCIGFLVDTSGSMREEIAAARRVILQFMKSQANSSVCYLLVSFNDFDDYHYAAKGFSEEDSKPC